MHSIQYDPVHDEIIVANRFASAILTFRGSANGEEPPIREIVGLKTRIEGPDQIGYDDVHGEIYLPNGEEMLVFPRTANGDVAPIREFHGDFTVDAVAIDSLHDVVAVTGTLGTDRQRGILTFARKASGQVKPRSFIGGPSTGMESVRQIQVSSAKGGWILLSQALADEGRKAGSWFVGIWGLDDSGDVPPRWRIGGPISKLTLGRRMALVPKYKEILVADMNQNAIFTFYLPEIF
jgi:hypothetical protein